MITTYTFTLPKKNNNTSVNNFKETLAKKFLNAYPWYGKTKKEKKTTFDFYMSNTISTNSYYTADDFLSNKYNLEDEFFKAIAGITPFAKDYDFEDEFGTPIRIFDNFVQIGYDIIHITPGSLNYLKPKTKKTIIDITIKIKNNGWF